MRRLPYLDQRPIMVALTGPNGSGKTTFYHMLLEPAGLRFINADLLARELHVDAYQAANLGDAIRRALVGQGESFVFETVFSDPVGDKRRFLQDAVRAGYTVVVYYIGVSSPTVSEERVALRVAKGGHDVPTDKLVSRFPRTLSNLMAPFKSSRTSSCSITRTWTPHSGTWRRSRMGKRSKCTSPFRGGCVLRCFNSPSTCS